eukprot:IDg13343t1
MGFALACFTYLATILSLSACLKLDADFVATMCVRHFLYNTAVTLPIDFVYLRSHLTSQFAKASRHHQQTDCRKGNCISMADNCNSGANRASKCAQLPMLNDSHVCINHKEVLGRIQFIVTEQDPSAIRKMIVTMALPICCEHRPKVRNLLILLLLVSLLLVILFAAQAAGET